MTNKRYQDMFRVFSLVSFEGIAVWLLHRIGTRPYVGIDWRDMSRWLTDSPVDQIVVSVVWLVALVLAWWTFGSTLLYVVVRVRGVRFGAGLAERLALPMVRQMVDRAVATTLVTSALFGAAPAALAAEPSAPMVAQEQPLSEYEPQPAGTEGAVAPGPQRRAPKPVDPPASLTEEPAKRDGDAERSGNKRDGEKAEKRDGDAAEQRDGDGGRSEKKRDGDAAEQRDGDGGRSEKKRDGDAADQRDRVGEKAEKRDGDERKDRAARTAAGTWSTPRPGRTYTVRVGDHLWKIATDVVSTNGGTAGRRAVASYWAELVRVATPQLRSGDPNLIYPGETLDLPPLRSGTEGGR